MLLPLSVKLPAPRINVELDELPFKITLPVFTVNAVVKVALFTLLAVPVMFAVIVPALKLPYISLATIVAVSYTHLRAHETPEHHV